MKAWRKFALMVLVLFGLSYALWAQQNLKAIMMEKIQQFYLKRFAVPEQNLRLTFVRLPDVKRIPLNDVKIECYAQSNLLRLGRQSIWVRFIKDQKTIFKTPVTVDVSVKKRIFLTLENIGYRKRMREDKILSEEIWIHDTETYLKAITDQKQIAGKESTHFIPRGKILLTTDVQQPTVVKPGDEVEICIRAGELVLKTRGIARSAGSVGDEVSVKNIMTGKNLKGRVTSPGIVFINQSRSL